METTCISSSIESSVGQFWKRLRLTKDCNARRKKKKEEEEEEEEDEEEGIISNVQIRNKTLKSEVLPQANAKVKYMKFVSFSWSPAEAAISIF